MSEHDAALIENSANAVRSVLTDANTASIQIIQTKAVQDATNLKEKHEEAE